jgi:putative transferase (TIGR04331 family)
MTKRRKFQEQVSSDQFEHFLIHTLAFCFPKILIEYFEEYYTVFEKDVKEAPFTHIVSEVWRSFLPISIYLGVAQYHGKKLLFQQHGASTQWRSVHIEWLEHLVADAYITTGWKADNLKIIQGGWAVREIRPHKFTSENTAITFISSTSPNYLYEMSGIKVNSRFIYYLRNVHEFMETLPESLRPHLVFRPRRARYLWDTENSLEIDRDKFIVDTESSPESYSHLLTKSRIVIIDHLTTGIAEILSNNIPCLILHDPSFDYLSPEFTAPFYNDLVRCGVIHNSPQSAVNFLEEIYAAVESWWTSDFVRNALRKLVHNNIAPPSRTVEYLLSCLNDTRDACMGTTGTMTCN